MVTSLLGKKAAFLCQSVSCLCISRRPSLKLFPSSMLFLCLRNFHMWAFGGMRLIRKLHLWAMVPLTVGGCRFIPRLLLVCKRYVQPKHFKRPWFFRKEKVPVYHHQLFFLATGIAAFYLTPSQMLTLHLMQLQGQGRTRSGVDPALILLVRLTCFLNKGCIL